MERDIKGIHLIETHWSLAEFADYSAKHAKAEKAHRCAKNRSFSHVSSHGEAVKLAKTGWTEELPGAMELAESAVQTADKEHMTETFAPIWDVSGAEVDVATFLAGTPECMIDYPLSPTSKSGRVITLVASMSVSAAVEAESMIRRGRVVVALAIALSKLGHNIEIWVDCAVTAHGKRSTDRVLIKGASDEIDAGALLFALAHPAMLRALIFGAKDGYPEPWQSAFGGPVYGYPASRAERDTAMYPEGTIFLPQIRSGSDVPDADEFLREHLGNLGLLAE